MAVALVVLASCAFALVARQANRTARQQTEAQLGETANAIALAVDGELKQGLGILSALRASDAARSHDWAELDRQARAAMPNRDAWILVQDRQGRQLVNTLLPPGAALPVGKPPPEMWSKIASGRSHICNLVQGFVEPKLTCVDMPLQAGANSPFAISMGFRPAFFREVVSRSQVGGGHLASLVDRNGRMIWRNINPERFVGQYASDSMRRMVASAPVGTEETVTLDGMKVLSSHRRSMLSGWTVIIATPISLANAAGREAQWRGSLVALGMLVLGALLALFIARRVSRALDKLRLAATDGTFENGRPFQLTGFHELDALAEGLRRAGELRQESERQMHASEERYRRIFEQTSDLLLTADLDQVINDCNPAAAAAVGLTREQAIGRRISDFISPEDYERTSAMLARKLDDGGTTRYDVQVRSTTGELLSWEVNSGLTHDENGAPVGLHVVGRDVTERKLAERHQQLLTAELDHRVKNTLAIVQSVAFQTFKPGTDSDAARRAFEGRLAALAGAHNLLTREKWSSAEVSDVLRAALAPFCGEDRCSMSGPPLRILPKTAVSLTLAVHELATNASKYGALSVDSGHVTLNWRIDGGDLELTWRERGGPPVTAPSRTGFGMRMIQRGLASELGGTVNVIFDPAGVECTVRAPAPPPLP